MTTWGDPPSDDELAAIVRGGLHQAADQVHVRPALAQIWRRIRGRHVWTTPCCGIPNPCPVCGACLCADRLPRCAGGCQR